MHDIYSYTCMHSNTNYVQMACGCVSCLVPISANSSCIVSESVPC